MATLSLKRKFHSFAQTEQFYDLCVRAARLGVPELYRAASTISLFRRTEESCSEDEIVDAYNAVRQGFHEGEEYKILREGASEDEKTFLLLAYRHAMIWGKSKSDAYQWELYYEKPGAVYWTLYEYVVNAEKAGTRADGYGWLVNGTGLRDAIDLGATDVVELYSRSGFRSFPLSKVVLDAMLKSRDIFEAIRPLLRDAEISFEKDDFDPRKVVESLMVRPVGELRELVALVDGHSACPGTFLKIGAKWGALASAVPDLLRLKVLLELGMECNPENCLSFDYDASPPSALYSAVEEDSLDAVKLLLGYGADPDSGSCAWSACAAALKGRNLDVLKALVAAGAEIDHNCNWKGKIKSPLRIALDNGDYDLVRKLIALGADPSLTALGEVVYQKAVKVEDIPADLRSLFEEGAGRSVPCGKYCGEGEYRNPYIGRMPECVFWQCEYDGWIRWGDGNVGLAWARKLYLAAEAGGKLPRWLDECAQPVQEKILALWIYVNYCNRHVWPEGLATTWSSRYIVAKHHDFWHEVPPCARAIDWTSYWTRCPPKPRIKVVVGDMASIEVDAIVNATGEGLIGTGGLSGALFKAAGPALEKECLKFPADGKGVRCPVGEIRVTSAGKLPAKCVIHTVGPTFKDGSWGEPLALERCYRKSLEHVVSAGLKSIAFPCISTGKHGYPFDQAARIAVNTVRNFLKFHNEVEVIFCIYNDPAASEVQKEVYEKLIG